MPDLEQSDLPPVWRLVRTADAELDRRLEGALEQSRSPDEVELRRGRIVEPLNEEALLSVAHGWFLLRHDKSGEQAWIRLQDWPWEYGSRVSGAVFLPSRPGQRIVSTTARSLSFAAIESAIADRIAARIGTSPRTVRFAGDDWTPEQPVGSPREVQDFYERVAEQYLHLRGQGVERPVARMVEINGRPAKTVQGWVTQARKLRHLPAGTPGRA